MMSHTIIIQYYEDGEIVFVMPNEAPQEILKGLAEVINKEVFNVTIAELEAKVEEQETIIGNLEYDLQEAKDNLEIVEDNMHYIPLTRDDVDYDR